MTRGTKLINRGSFAQAAEAFFSATQLRWTFTEAHIELGNAYSALKQYDKALDAYTNAIENDPTSIIAHYNIALTFTDLTQLDKALHWLECLIQIDPKYQIAYIPLARSLLTTAQPKKAVTQLLFAAKLSKPHHPDLLVQAGKVYEQLNNNRRAFRCYLRALKSDPWHASALYSIGLHQLPRNSSSIGNRSRNNSLLRNTEGPANLASTILSRGRFDLKK